MPVSSYSKPYIYPFFPQDLMLEKSEQLKITEGSLFMVTADFSTRPRKKRFTPWCFSHFILLVGLSCSHSVSLLLSQALFPHCTESVWPFLLPFQLAVFFDESVLSSLSLCLWFLSWIFSVFPRPSSSTFLLTVFLLLFSSSSVSIGKNHPCFHLNSSHVARFWRSLSLE